MSLKEIGAVTRQAPAAQTEAPHGFAVGISHYHKEQGKSYIQIHDDLAHDNHDDAVAAIHARIDQHANLEHGVYDPEKLNPNGQHAPHIVKSNAEYHTLPRAWVTLPMECALEGCEKQLTDEMYLPHVDNTRLGHCYQAVLQAQDPQPKSLDYYDLGFCSKEHAIAGAHAIVDHILVPYAQQLDNAVAPAPEPTETEGTE